MSRIITATETVPSAPASGNGAIWLDTTGGGILCVRTSDGAVQAYTKNSAVAAQGAGFASDTYVTNSDLLIPSFGLQAKTQIIWAISASKTGAGTAQPAYAIRIGSARTTADTARLTLTGPAQTAVADIGTLWIMLTIRNVGASGVIQGTAWWNHQGTATNTTTQGTGFANNGSGHIEGSGSGFDNSNLGGNYIGLSINGGTSASWTLTQVQAEASW